MLFTKINPKSLMKFLSINSLKFKYDFIIWCDYYIKSINLENTFDPC